MATRSKKSPLKKIARDVADWGTLLLNLKNSVVHPGETIGEFLLDKLKEIGREDTHLRGMIKNRVQIYNRKIKRWVVVDKETGKILRTSPHKYKRIREI